MDHIQDNDYVVVVADILCMAVELAVAVVGLAEKMVAVEVLQPVLVVDFVAVALELMLVLLVDVVLVVRLDVVKHLTLAVVVEKMKSAKFK